MATTTFRKSRVSREMLAVLAAVGSAFLLGGATGYIAKEDGGSQPAVTSAHSAIKAPAAVTGSVDRGSVHRLGTNAPGFVDPAQPGISGGAAVSAGTSVCDREACITSGPIYHDPESRAGGVKI